MSTKLTITIPTWLDKVCAWPMMLYRKYKYDYAFRRIPLGEGEFTLVEQDDYYRFGKFHWHIGGNDQRVYVVRSYRTESKKLKYVSLHREIMNNPKGFLIDHRNGNTFDNRRTNLRKATHTQNMHNCRKMKNTTSQFRGVSFIKDRKLWQSQITNKGKTIHLGRFKNEIDAARTYDAAAKKYFGEFAKLNFPEEIERSPRRLNLRLANWLGARLNFPE